MRRSMLIANVQWSALDSNWMSISSVWSRYLSETNMTSGKVSLKTCWKKMRKYSTASSSRMILGAVPHAAKLPPGLSSDG
eukprot:5398919-Alexandrium_andersonii.AAC.1